MSRYKITAWALVLSGWLLYTLANGLPRIRGRLLDLLDASGTVSAQLEGTPVMDG